MLYLDILGYIVVTALVAFLLLMLVSGAIYLIRDLKGDD